MNPKDVVATSNDFLAEQAICLLECVNAQSMLEADIDGRSRGHGLVMAIVWTRHPLFLLTSSES